jgi:hypothetical protein
VHEDEQFLEETFRRQTMQQSLMEAACNGNVHLGGPLGSRVGVQTGILFFSFEKLMISESH